MNLMKWSTYFIFVFILFYNFKYRCNVIEMHWSAGIEISVKYLNNKIELYVL